MRVYELAREINIASKELIKLLNKKGFSVASHMAVLSDEAVSAMRKHAARPAPVKSKPASAQQTSSSKPVAKKAAPSTKSKSQEQKKTAPHKPRGQSYKGKKGYSSRKGTQRYQQHQPQRTKKFLNVVTSITVSCSKPLHEVATQMGKQSGELILALLKSGIMCNRNALLEKQTIIMLAKQFGLHVIEETDKEKEIDRHISQSARGVSRWPIVVVMGHVDHGKTTFLDYIRKMNTVAKEKGGITQHLAAYPVDSTHGTIVFLDTPGHEAFSYMRKRGAHVTDIAILMVAADDGIKPQTIEAIKHAQKTEVPIVVAINKVDKVEDRVGAVERVKRQLAELGLIPEDWGGETMCVPISAKTGEGISDLLEMVTLQAELLENKANPELPAKAFVLETKIQRGYGPVATVICLEGTLHIGDYFVCGSTSGRVRLLITSEGKKIRQAGPSVPVQLVGFDTFAGLGDWLQVVEQKAYSKTRSRSSQTYTRSNMYTARNDAHDKYNYKYESAIDPITLILKADTHGSLQAVKDSIDSMQKKLGSNAVPIRIVHEGIGDASERDVLLAMDTDALIMALHVKAERNALLLAKEKNIGILSFQIVYRLLDHISHIIDQRRKATTVLRKIGEAVVKKIFDLKSRGVIAGCYIKKGKIKNTSVVMCYRDGKKIGQSEIKSLQRERKVVTQVQEEQECGFITSAFHGWQEDDTVFIFEKIQHAEL